MVYIIIHITYKMRSDGGPCVAEAWGKLPLLPPPPLGRAWSNLLVMVLGIADVCVTAHSAMSKWQNPNRANVSYQTRKGTSFRSNPSPRTSLFWLQR
jgi:hypothetical protein